MSILIKGMKMPERCEDCVMYRHNAEYDYAYCRISYVNVLGHGNARLNNCPLIEVPTPHGRLIDEKQIPYIDLNADMPQSKVRVWTTFKDKIDRLPTIIEAEEGEGE